MKNYGIVDMGSNTIRLSIYQWDEGKVKLLLNRKEMAGLASYVCNGALSDEGIDVACQVIASYRQLLDNLRISDMHVFATASLRNVVNTQEAVDAIDKATGVTIDVVSGNDEAALSFRGAMAHVSMESGILIDLGGGSTEIVHFKDRSITSECSIPSGSLSLYSRYVGGIYPTKHERHAIENEVEHMLEKWESDFAPVDEICGVGGTVRAVRKLANHYFERPKDYSCFTSEELNELYQSIKNPNTEGLQMLFQIMPDRLHTIIPGMIALRTIVKKYGCKRIVVSDTGVREGYLYSKVLAEYGCAGTVL